MARRKRYRRRTPITTWLARIVVLGVFGSIAFAGYSWWKVQQNVSAMLDGWASQAAPFGELRYLDVSAGFDGAITIRGLSFYPSNDADLPPLITERITVRYPDFLSMIGVGREGPPRRLSATVEGVRVDAALGGRLISGNPFEALACGDVDEFTRIDLEAMGFFSPRVTIAGEYNLEPAIDQVRISAVQSTGDFARIDLDVNLQVPGLRRVAAGTGAINFETAGVSGLSLALDSTQFNPARNRYCAEQLGISADDAVDANVAAALAHLAEAGWVPSDALVDQYRVFMQGSGIWEFSAARDSGPLNPQSLVGLELPELLRETGLRSSIGDEQEVPIEVTRFVIEEEEDEFDQGGDIVAGGQPRARWRVVPPEELEQYVGRNVLIITRQRQRYSGRLLGLDESELRISTRLPGGAATVPIARNKISEVRVYR